MELESTQNIDRQSIIEKDVTRALDFQDSPTSTFRSHHKKSTMFHPSVTRLDRWLVKKMVDVVGNPPVRISLWDGIEVTPPCDNPIAIMIYYNWRTV